MKDILSGIQNGMGGFSKRQKLIARFIIESYDKAAFMTATKLGEAVGVSESTVVRFAAELGYDGYPGMQRALQETVRSKLTALQRIEVTDDRLGNQDILSMVLHADAEKIRYTLEEIDRKQFDGAVAAISGARRLFILGMRSAASIAAFMGFYCNLMFENVTVIHTNSVSEALEQILRAGPGDVVIGISFPRYSSLTVRAMRYAGGNGASVVALTDSVVSPITGAADYVLLAKSDMVSFIDSLVAPLSLINALLVAVSRQKRQELQKTFETLEEIWSEYEVYERIEE